MPRLAFPWRFTSIRPAPADSAGILATLVAFWPSNRWPAVLLMPYLAWVSFAAVLNFTLWQLNR